MKKYISALIVVLVALPAFSQNLDPTVVITKSFEAKKLDVGKKSVQMEVPDSVLKFNLDFDYQVKPSPYGASYEFKPYFVDVRPESSPAGKPWFYLRAGAGYVPHPEVDLVVSPSFGKAPFSMSIYGTHRSYWGNYCAVLGNPKFNGWDSFTSGGIDGRTDWGTGYFSFDAQYLGYHSNAMADRRGFDAGKLTLKVASGPTRTTDFFYDVEVSHLWGEDKISPRGENSALTGYLMANEFDLNSTFGYDFSSLHKLLVDFDFDLNHYLLSSRVEQGVRADKLPVCNGKVSIVPRYRLDWERWHLTAGLNLSVLIGARKTDMMGNCRKMGQYVYPAIDLRFTAMKDYLDIYLKIKGGDDNNKLTSTLANNHFYTYKYGMNGIWLDNSLERVGTVLGFRGNVAAKFTFDVSGGYSYFSNMLLDAILLKDGMKTPGIGWSDCNYWFAKANLGWKSQDVDAKIAIRYQGTDLLKKAPEGCLGLSPLVGAAGVTYNWRQRLFVGVDCEAALARKGVVASIPGYADLGVNAEYWFNRNVSLWLAGHNLLNMKIQRSPMYCESGIYGTVGVTVKF